MAADLKKDDLETLEFAVETYGNKGEIDAFNLGQVMRCCNVNPSLDTLEKLGATKKQGEKKLKIAELAPILSQLIKEKKDQGCYEDFIECLKLYDKNENGKMQSGELTHSLLSLGEKLNDAEVDEIMDDCLDEEDDEGQIDYIPFLRRMCELDPPLKPKKPTH